MLPAKSQTFSILAHLDSLTPARGKNRFLCPACGGNDLTVNPRTGAYSCHHGCTSEQIRNAVAPLPERENKWRAWTKPRRPRQSRGWVYCDRNGQPLIRVNRTDSGSGEKRIWQTSLIEGRQPAKLLPLVVPYRYQDCLAAIERGEGVFWVEGETSADALWTIGIAATTTIRGSDGYSSQYAGLFPSESVVICPDRDKPGLKYAETIAADYATASWLYAEPNHPEWENIPAMGGFDIQDWIEFGATREQILASIGGRRSEQSLEPDSDNEDDSVADELDHLNGLNGLSKPQILPDALETPISKLAERLNLPSEAFIGVLLSVAASQINSRTRLALDPSTGYHAPPILWAGIVGESGSKKSPLLRAITNPLDALQERAETMFQDAMDAYEQDVLDWEATPKEKRDKKPRPPVADEFYLSDFTMEALGGVLGNQVDRGVLVNIDELARFFTSMDAYRGGKGGDRQHWLTFYDGGAFKSNRKSTGRVYARRTSVSLAGGIQPSVLQRIWSEDKSSEDGLWSRFAWVKIPLSISPGIGEGDTCDLPGLLTDLYQRLAEYPEQQFALTDEARQLWNQWHHEIEQSVLREPSGILRATYPKAKERAARIALITHMIEAAMSGMTPNPEISAERLGLGIEFTRWLMGQTRLLYAESGVTDSPETARILKFVNRFRGCGWVTARQVRNWWTGKEKPSAETSREFMRRVVSLGYAVGNGKEGSAYEIQISEFGSPLVHQPTEPSHSNGSSMDYQVVHDVVQVVHDVVQVVHDVVQGEEDRQTDPWSNGLPHGLPLDYMDYQVDYQVVHAETQLEQGFQPSRTTWTTNSVGIGVSARVRYAGADIPTAQILRDHVLTVTALNRTMATVAAPELTSPVDVAIADLEVAA